MFQRKDIYWYEWIYQVNNLWQVRSLDRNIIDRSWKFRPFTWKILSQKRWNNKHIQVTLSNNWKRKSYLVHRMVANAFIQNPENKSCVDHKDNNPRNNNMENLQRVTHSENERYKHWRDWYICTNTKKVIQKSKDNKVIWIYDSIVEAYKKLSISKQSISNCICWRSNTAWWYKRFLA